MKIVHVLRNRYLKTLKRLHKYMKKKIQTEANSCKNFQETMSKII